MTSFIQGLSLVTISPQGIFTCTPSCTTLEYWWTKENCCHLSSHSTRTLLLTNAYAKASLKISWLLLQLLFLQFLLLSFTTQKVNPRPVQALFLLCEKWSLLLATKFYSLSSLTYFNLSFYENFYSLKSYHLIFIKTFQAIHSTTRRFIFFGSNCWEVLKLTPYSISHLISFHNNLPFHLKLPFLGSWLYPS